MIILKSWRNLWFWSDSRVFDFTYQSFKAVNLPLQRPCQYTEQLIHLDNENKDLSLTHWSYLKCTLSSVNDNEQTWFPVCPFSRKVTVIFSNTFWRTRLDRYAVKRGLKKTDPNCIWLTLTLFKLLINPASFQTTYPHTSHNAAHSETKLFFRLPKTYLFLFSLEMWFQSMSMLVN